MTPVLDAAPPASRASETKAAEARASGVRGVNARRATITANAPPANVQ